MKKRVYKIDYARDISQVTWDYQSLSDTDRIQITNFTFECSMDFVDKHQNYNMIIVTEPKEIDKLTKILTSNYIIHFSKDITEEILTNKLSIKQVVYEKGVENLDLYEKFKEKLNKWILDNLELDIVLDLINEKGIEKLREVDRKFLENYGK
jgi:hypothetical protein